VHAAVFDFSVAFPVFFYLSEIIFTMESDQMGSDLECYARVCEKLALSVSRYIPGISVEGPRPCDCDHILRRR